ncbi:serine/threonine-protein kinase [Streptomyces libani]
MNGRVIGERYELSALLGQGGMGQVWIGYDRRLDRRVGVKLLRPDRVAGTPDGEEMRRRFVRECRVTAQVDHPGLVTVHDAGSDDEDLYLVMQYVEGADLSDHLAEHDPYPWPWAVSVAAQLCAVLASVHAVPIVHRDLKPRNVMIRPDGSVVILDLGIASALDTDTTRLTHTGSPIGSPAYMAPEQAMGGAVGPHTDLYALGVLLHELLSGEVPFAGSTALGVLHRHLHEEPVPVRTLRPDVPEALEALVLRLLRKDPQARPADAQEVYQSLAPLLPTATIGPQAAQSPPTPLAPMDPTRPFRQPHAPWPARSSGTLAPTPTALSTPQVPEPLVPAGAAAAYPGRGPAASLRPCRGRLRLPPGRRPPHLRRPRRGPHLPPRRLDLRLRPPHLLRFPFPFPFSFRLRTGRRGRRRRGQEPARPGPDHPRRGHPRRHPARRRRTARRPLPGRPHPAQAVRRHPHGRRPVPPRPARTPAAGRGVRQGIRRRRHPPGPPVPLRGRPVPRTTRRGRPGPGGVPAPSSPTSSTTPTTPYAPSKSAAP